MVSLCAIVSFFAVFGCKSAKSAVPESPASAATAATAATSPIPTPKLLLWLRADAGVTKDTANHVVTWADQSGHKIDAGQATPGAQPLFVTDAGNGKPAIRFDGKQDYLSMPTGSADFSHGMSLFAVVNPTGNSAWGRVIDLGDETYGFGVMRHDNSTNWEYFVSNGKWNEVDNDRYTGLTLNSPQLLEVVVAPDGGTALRKSASPPVTASFPLLARMTFTQNYLGASPKDKQYWSGDFAEILLYHAALTDADRQQVEHYLLDKYAIQPVTGSTEPKPLLKTAKRVPVQYYLSLPHGWTADKAWPIVVTINGVGGDCLGNCTDFVEARKDRPYIIVTPCVYSNGNDPQDKEAVIAIAREVQQEYHGEQHFFLTGFSAGGHVTWQIIFGHPELLAGAVLSSGNFVGRGIAAISQAPERVHLPIHGIVGEHDYPGYAQQRANGQQVARNNGYQDLSVEDVPGGGHYSYPDQVLAFCDSVWSPINPRRTCSIPELTSLIWHGADPKNNFRYRG
jgi:predicted esterase